MPRKLWYVPFAAARAAIAFSGHAKIVKALELLQIAIGLESEMVIALFVRAAREVERALEAAIDVDRNVELDGADEAGRRAGALLGLGNRRELE